MISKIEFLVQIYYSRATAVNLDSLIKESKFLFRFNPCNSIFATIRRTTSIF